MVPLFHPYQNVWFLYHLGLSTQKYLDPLPLKSMKVKIFDSFTLYACPRKNMLHFTFTIILIGLLSFFILISNSIMEFVKGSAKIIVTISKFIHISLFCSFCLWQIIFVTLIVKVGPGIKIKQTCTLTKQSYILMLIIYVIFYNKFTFIKSILFSA